jgi:hypothetical protein
VDALTAIKLDALEKRVALLEAARSARSASAPDRAVRLREACAIKAWDYSYASKHWQKLGGYKDVDGRVKFPLSALRPEGPPE